MEAVQQVIIELVLFQSLHTEVVAILYISPRLGIAIQLLMLIMKRVLYPLQRPHLPVVVGVQTFRWGQIVQQELLNGILSVRVELPLLQQGLLLPLG